MVQLNATPSDARSSCSGRINGKVQFIRAGARTTQALAKVYLNGADMAAAKIDTGSVVVVSQAVSANDAAHAPELVLCGVAWPLHKVKRHGVGVSFVWEAWLTPQLEALNVHGVDVVALKDAHWVAKRVAKSVELVVTSRATHKAAPSAPEQLLLAHYVRAMLDGVLLHIDAQISLSVHGINTVFRVKSVTSDSTANGGVAVFHVAPETSVHVQWEMETSPAATAIPDSSSTDKSVKKDEAARGFAAVGGLKAEIATIRQIIEQPLVNPENFAKFGLPPPKGLLMFGPPGTGKTLIARCLAAELDAKIFFINGPEIVSKFIGESEANLRRIFRQASEQGPSLIFIDEIDAICPKRDGRVGDMEKRMVATLLTMMDGLEKQSQVVVLGATNRPNALDPAIRRPGRFDREVEISIPNANDRLEILQVLLARIPHRVTDEELLELSSNAHGYVGADLSAICKEAALLALRRSFAARDPANRDPLQPLHASEAGFEVTLGDLKQAMAGIRPSALREIAIDVPRVLWSDIGGQHMIKQQLKEAVEWPLQHPEAFVRMGIRPPKGVLLYGPPGCSKTLTAKALATESGMNFIAVKGPELYSKWVGESEKAVASIFRKARAAAPTVIFFDEIDAIASQRGGDGSSQVADRVLSQLLTEMDGIEPLKQVLIVAATNRPDLIDNALMRPGRIDRVLYVGPPDLQARLEILSIHCRKMPLDADVNLQEIAVLTEQFSGAELFSLCREAAMRAIEEDKRAEVVARRHFLQALSCIQPQIDDNMLEFFQNFRTRRKR
ncbi:TPA: hypothetical protein N0F65_004149 [Lagenidium giganteum]|uniref:AAA+ ATPase domain-containing protein n=1 Tax=Lagenidium giganteum TaxID=4803 RepID=A0AAV2ZEP2_9STRA|nr:TPA: hypothetical protein N0F65_004149 [Lagenidium giganteum]